MHGTKEVWKFFFTDMKKVKLWVFLDNSILESETKKLYLIFGQV
jgi:hypothetical protein